MGLAARRIIQTIAKRNRLTTGGAGGRFVCIGKDTLAYTSPGATLLGVDEENCGATFVITSQRQDRDGDVVRPRGLRLESWKRSPVWFWNHQQEPLPIGSGRHPKTGMVNVQVSETQVIATCYFDPGDQLAMEIFRKIKGGYISACSIGFVPERMDRLSKANRDHLAQPNGYDVEAAELVEVSVVGVGSNRDAFLVGRSFGSSSIRGLGAKYMKNRIRNLPSKTKPKMLGTIKPINETETGKEEGISATNDTPIEGKSSAADVQHVALSKEMFPNQADAMSWVDKQGLLTDDAQETDTDWTFHQFPEDELVEGTGDYQDLADGIKAYAGQRQMEPASDLEEKTDGDVGPTDDPPEVEMETDEPMLPSAQALMDLISHATEQAASLEQPDIKLFYEDLLAEAQKLADMIHPDVELYDKPAGSEATESIKDMDEDAMEKGLPYRHRRSLLTKGMSRKCMKSLSEAADHLDDVAELDANDQKGLRAIKTCSRYHAKELRSMVKEPGNGDTDATDAGMYDDEPSGKGAVLSLKDIMDAATLTTKAAHDLDRKSKQVIGR
jgi:HK97 family phage prohead protease